MEILIKASQLLLSLSILIVLHELGHFIPAKLFKTRVEKFYLFFDWKFSLFKVKKGETEYGIGWIPLGGYVKIAGMIDESMDKEQMARPAQPWEFRAKPTWQRLIIMVGGVTVNLLLGFLIYSMILFTWGTTKLPLSEMKYGVHVDSLLQKYGLRDGDKIIALGAARPFDIAEFSKELILGDPASVTVERAGQQLTFQIPADFEKQVLSANHKGPLIMERIPAVVDSLLKDHPAASTTLQRGDSIIAVNGETAEYVYTIFSKLQDKAGKDVTITARAPDGTVKTVSLRLTEKAKAGIQWKEPRTFFKFHTEEYGFFESFPAGVRYGLNTLNDYVKQLPLIFTRAGAKQLGGFGSMGSLFPSEWSAISFWKLTAFLSIVLAFMNILPIPALDGGHVLFLLWEMITGKAAPEKVMEYAQYVGMALLLSLMLYANGNDIYRALAGYFN